MKEEIKTWDIWWANVAFEDDPTKAKERPVLVSSKKECYVLSMKITSHEPREDFEGEYPVKYWAESGLTKPSTIRFTKRLRLSEQDMISKIGRLHPTDIMNLQRMMMLIINNK